MSQPQIRIHQIFYDERSRALLDPGFIALDNTDMQTLWDALELPVPIRIDP